MLPSTVPSFPGLMLRHCRPVRLIDALRHGGETEFCHPKRLARRLGAGRPETIDADSGLEHPLGSVGDIAPRLSREKVAQMVG